MNIIKNITLTVFITLLFFVVLPVNADNNSKASDKNNNVTFKEVMQGLLIDSKNITEGIVLVDFSLIENAASNIEQHPKPSMSQRKKLMKALASEITTFKRFDHVVHEGALRIKQAARDKNIDAVIDEYQKFIIGCQSCHSLFKSRLSKALQ